MKIAVYPGSFDLITNGHIDIIERASELFDILYVTVLDNPSKNNLFSVDCRKEMISEVCKKYSNVCVDSSNDLAVTYAQKKGAKFIVRGLRATLDFEYELNIFAFNKHINDEIDTIFLMTTLKNSFISSSGIKEMVMYNTSVKELVHPFVEKKLVAKIKEKKDDVSCI